MVFLENSFLSQDFGTEVKSIAIVREPLMLIACVRPFAVSLWSLSYLIPVIPKDHPQQRTFYKAEFVPELMRASDEPDEDKRQAALTAAKMEYREAADMKCREVKGDGNVLMFTNDESPDQTGVGVERFEGTWEEKGGEVREKWEKEGMKKRNAVWRCADPILIVVNAEKLKCSSGTNKIGYKFAVDAKQLKQDGVFSNAILKNWLEESPYRTVWSKALGRYTSMSELERLRKQQEAFLRKQQLEEVKEVTEVEEVTSVVGEENVLKTIDANDLSLAKQIGGLENRPKSATASTTGTTGTNGLQGHQGAGVQF